MHLGQEELAMVNVRASVKNYEVKSFIDQRWQSYSSNLNGRRRNREIGGIVC